MNKQIEEMAKIIVANSYLCKDGYLSTTGKHNRDHCEKCDLVNACIPHRQATDLYKAGYRKSADVAREIFEKFDYILKQIRYDCDYSIFDAQRDFAELKKKYESEGADDDL